MVEMVRGRVCVGGLWVMWVGVGVGGWVGDPTVGDRWVTCRLEGPEAPEVLVEGPG